MINLSWGILLNLQSMVVRIELVTVMCFYGNYHLAPTLVSSYQDSRAQYLISSNDTVVRWLELSSGERPLLM